MTNEIRIHQPGTRITDAEKVDALSAAYPRSFRIAQDVLVAAKKYHSKKGGLFSSERSRVQTLQQYLYQLRDALEAESFGSSEVKVKDASNVLDMGGDVVIAFLSEFSDAFPNWQPEYAVLNRFIPMCF